MFFFFNFCACFSTQNNKPYPHRSLLLLARLPLERVGVDGPVPELAGGGTAASLVFDDGKWRGGLPVVVVVVAAEEAAAPPLPPFLRTSNVALAPAGEAAAATAAAAAA